MSTCPSPLRVRLMLCRSPATKPQHSLSLMNVYWYVMREVLLLVLLHEKGNATEIVVTEAGSVLFIVCTGTPSGVRKNWGVAQCGQREGDR